MSAMAGPGGMVTGQVWDAAPIPGRRLYPGRPTGAAMPLAWAHAEFVKLAQSWTLQRPFDRPEAVWRRYRGERPMPPGFGIWSASAPLSTLAAGQQQRHKQPRTTTDHKQHTTGDAQRTSTRHAGLGLHMAEIDLKHSISGEVLRFRLHYDTEAEPHDERAVTIKGTGGP